MCDQPDKDIYKFTGIYMLEDPTTGETAREPMNYDNTMWANTVLASQHMVLGIVIYTGRETRS